MSCCGFMQSKYHGISKLEVTLEPYPANQAASLGNQPQTRSCADLRAARRVPIGGFVDVSYRSVLIFPPVERPLFVTLLPFYTRSLRFLGIARMPGIKNKKKGRKGVSMPLTPPTPGEETALRLYNKGTISIEEYSTLIGCPTVVSAEPEGIISPSEE